MKLHWLLVLLLPLTSAHATEWRVKQVTPSMRLYTPQHAEAPMVEALQHANQVFTTWFEAPTDLDIVIADSKSQLDVLPSDLAERRLSFALPELAEKAENHSSVAGIVAHEACHLWLIDYAKGQGLEQPKSQVPAYGHGQLTDWLDETIAVACEPDALAITRRDREFEHIPLTTFLTQTHPVYAMIEAKLAAIMAARTGKTTGQQTVRLSVDDNDLIHFYYQAAWFGDFLLSRESPITGKALLSLGRKGTTAEAIAQQLGAASIEDLDAQFINFKAR